MRDWLKKNDVLAKTLAVLIAVSMWFFVLSVDNPERTIDKRDIDVSLIGEDSLERQNLAIADKKVPEIDLKLGGTLSRLYDVEESNIIVRSDVSKITEPGVYDLTYDVSVIDGISIVSRSPNVITVTVEEVITKELPIQVNIIGDLAANLETDMAIVDPLRVRVRGIASEMEHASFAVVNVDAKDISDTYHKNVDYTIVDGNNKELKGDSLEKIDKKIDLEIPVYMFKDIDLAVDIVDGDCVSASDAKVTINPAKITVVGSIQDIEPMERVVLGTVDLNTFLRNYSSIMKLELPDSIRMKEEVFEATVSVTLPEIDTAMFAVDSIELVNVHNEYETIVETLSVVVTLRGREEELTKITPDMLSLVVDMKNGKPKEGRNLYKAEVRFSEDSPTVGVYGTYNIVINAAEKTIDMEGGDLPVINQE